MSNRSLPSFTLRCAALQLAVAGLLGAGVGAVTLLPSVAFAQQQAQQTFAIAAGSLDQALSKFAAQAGVSLSIDADTTRGLQSPGLQGSYSVNDGFKQLLQGSGLQAVQQTNGTYTLQKAPAVGLLKAVKVTAEEINVTEGTGSLTTKGPVSAATGLALTLRETPQSITVMTRERLDQQNLNTIADIAEQVTGVFYNNKGTSIGGRTLMYSRGYEVDSYQVDGVNVPWEALAESERYGHGSLDTAIYDSVTVVRGSTGLLTGTGDPSALMSLTRKKPTAEQQTIVEVSAGSWSHYRGMVDVGGNLNESGSLRGRVVGAYDESETWVDNYSNDRSIFYGVLEADFSEKTLFTVTLEHGTANSSGAPWAEDYGSYIYFGDDETLMPADPSTSIAPHWSYLDSDRTFVSTALDHQFNDNWKGKLSYSYGKFNSDMRRGMVNFIPADGSPVAARVLSLDYSYDTHIVDAQVSGKYELFGREHDLVGGINMYRNDQAAPLGVYDVLPAQASWSNGQLNYVNPDWDAMPGSAGDYPYDIDTRQEGAYIATRLRPAERLSVILGGRLTNWEYFYADRATPDHDYYVYSDLDYNNEFTPYAGVVADLSNNISAYASYTQIFKPQEVSDAGGTLLEPEEGTTLEAGLKGAWFDGQLNASFAVFESKRDNLAVELLDAGGEPVLTPKGDQAYRAEDHTEGSGWELEIAGELAPGWNIQAGYTRFKSEDSAGNNLDTTQPEQMFKLYTDYRAIPKLTLGASLRWQDGTSADPSWIVGDPQFYNIDSYIVVGAHAGYELTEQLALDLVINNLLDEEYRVSNYGHSYGAERNFTLKATYSF
ncbi:MAG: TonB-dependent siderophore receptor [Cellvibrio sp.]|uniref:TonB-dependent siderophore receptor n=1 Tax=Cellvibrio sp. TaxID=1965322 RepID=UPI0031A1AF96